MFLRKKPVQLEELSIEEIAQFFFSSIKNHYHYKDAQFIINVIENSEVISQIEFAKRYLGYPLKSVINWIISESDLIVCDKNKFIFNLIKILKQCPEITAKARFVKLDNLYYLFKNCQHNEVNKYFEDGVEHYEIVTNHGSAVAKYRNGWLTSKTNTVQDYRRAIIFIERINKFIFISQFDLNDDIVFYLKLFYLSVNNEFKIL